LDAKDFDRQYQEYLLKLNTDDQKGQVNITAKKDFVSVEREPKPEYHHPFNYSFEDKVQGAIEGLTKYDEA
jgi:hypothetical protein